MVLIKQKAMDVLRPHLPRVTALTVESPSIERINNIFSLIIHGSDALPPLKSLSIIDSITSSEMVAPDGTRERLQQLLTLMRNLKYLYLDGAYLPYQSPAFRDLISLRLNTLNRDGHPTEAEFRNILLMSPLLESLHLQETGIILADKTRMDQSKSGSRVLLERLTTLRLSTMSWNAMEFVLWVVDAPNLSELAVEQPEEDYDDDAEPTDDMPEGIPRDEHTLRAIANFLVGPRPNQHSFLRSLRLESFVSMENCPYYTQILTAIPNLERLSLQDCHVAEIIEDLTIPTNATAPRFCAQLRYLKFSGCEILRAPLKESEPLL